MMRVGLDARTLFSEQRRGIGKSLMRLYQGLAIARPDWEIVAYHRSVGEVPADLPGQFLPRFIEMPGDRYDAWTQVRLPTTARLDRVSVLHCPANVCPSWMPVPTVVTLHDLIPLDLPAWQGSRELARFEQSVAAACSKATAVCTPSKYTKRRLVAEHGLRASRGVVVRWGATVERDPLDVGGVQSVLRSHGIDRDYLLHLGAADPRKNTRGVIESWAMVRQNIRRACKLVIVGLDDKTLMQIDKLARLLGVRESVLLHGYVSEADLPVLMSAASLLLYPSESEGFGLPILEAFSLATPVITSDTTSLPEIAGRAAELVPPGVATALATSITRLMQDPMRRAELAERGSLRLTKFKWADAVERFAEVLELASRTRRKRLRAGDRQQESPSNRRSAA